MARRAGALLFLPALVLLQAGSVPCPAATLEDLARAASLSPQARRLLEGRGPGNVFGAPDLQRPLVGVRFRPGSLDSGNRERLALWREAVDFVVVSSPEAALACEQAGVPWVGECGSAFGSRPVSATHRLGWLAPSGEGSSCADGRGDPVVPVADQATWAAPGRLSPPGAPAAGIRLVPARAASAGPGGQPPGPLIERRGETLRIGPPPSGDTAFVEWDVTLPPGALLTFAARHAGPGGDGALVSVKVSGTLKPEVLWERELLPGSAAVPAALDLNRWAGSRIRIRFDVSPGASRDAGGDLVELERPLLEAGGTHASLMETANWWRARCGYRPLGGPGPLRDVLTGPSGPSFDPDALTTALDRARRESLRPVLVDAHPTGSLDTASPAAFGMFWARVLQAKTAAVIFDDAAGGLEAMASELARWRNWMHLRPVAAGSPVQAPVAGAAVIVRSEVTAREEGLYCVEERGLLRVPDRLAAFHVSDRTPVSGFTDRHGLVVVFPRRGARVLDTGVCFPERVERRGRELELTLHCPPELAGTAASPYRIVFWTPDAPPPGLKAGNGWAVVALGDSFYEAVCSRAGPYVLKIPGAVAHRGPAEWIPLDH